MAEIESDPFDVPEVDSAGSGAPASGSPEPASTSATSDPAAAPATAATDPAAQSPIPAAPSPPGPFGALPPALARRMSEAELRPIAGETADQAQDRLYDHLTRRTKAHYARQRQLEETHAQEIRGLRESLDPIIREHYRRQTEAQTAALAAQMPEKGTPEYAEWLLEENLRAQYEERERLETERQAAEQQALEAAHQEKIREVDDWAYERVQEGLGLIPGAQADPEFTTAYDVFTRMALHSARAYFPEASDDQLAEFVNLSQTIDFRKFASMGNDPREVLKGRLRELNRLLPSGSVNGNGNGQPATGASATPASVPPAVPPTPATTPSPTAQRMMTESAASAARAPVAVPVASRAGGMGTPFPDIDGLEEDDYVLAALNNLVPEDQRIAKHRKER